MKHILSIAFAMENANFDEVITFRGEEIRLTQYSTNFDFELSKEIIEKYDGVCDVISIGGVPPQISYDKKRKTFMHPQSYRLKHMAKTTPVVDGQMLKDIYVPWAIRQFFLTNSKMIQGKKAAFYTGALQKPLLEFMEEIGNRVILADPYIFLKLPFNVHSSRTLERFISFLAPVFRKMTLKRSHLATFDLDELDLTKHLEEFYHSDIFVGNATFLNLVDHKHLKDKVVITDFLPPILKEKFKEAGVSKTIACMPNSTVNRPDLINFSVLEAILQSYQDDNQPMNDNDLLKWIDELKLKAEIVDLNTVNTDEKTKFAFIIHPLSARQVFKHPKLRFLKKYASTLEGVVEELMAFAPGIYYGAIKGVTSEKDGREVEGLIYTVTETPKKLMESDPTTIYKKLVGLCQKAADRGAGIIGLGAYTKIVGDAGVTVANQSPIPVTTGNSLSACSTLWAAKLAIEKMGFVETANGKYKGKVMVVGATGSIGAVSAKILAQQWDEIVLMAPRAYKLLELKEEILKIAPEAKVEVTTSADEYAFECDLIITTTSSRGAKVLDIMAVKPGCVICDVSRPFDIKEEDAVMRPDVLVIASGEVQLPGKVDMNIDIGLEGNIVYACLAETALLAMDGKLESFTLSRNISYEKVLEIDRMASEHGVRLSAIMGHSGFISDEEFELCKTHAEINRETWHLRDKS